MYLQNLHLINYKNFSIQSFDFNDKINCLVGNNGVGKTNILDAIYHLSQTKSYFNPTSIQNIKHGEDFFLIEGIFFYNDQANQIVCSFKKGQKKILKKNGKIYERFSEHIGNIPLVIISPSDRDLIIEGSETRRKFIDNVISQNNKVYLSDLIHYQKVLAQRNALLKYFYQNRTFNKTSLEVYNDLLNSYSSDIYKTRKEFIEKISPIFQKHYEAISNGNEKVEISYKSHLENDVLSNLLELNLQKDKVLQYTSVGIHRDDLEFLINGYPIQKFGSQGQQKSFLIALKLAQFDLIQQISNITPILLLDDIFDKLDDERVLKLIKMVENKHFGQIFISDTHFERTENVVKSTKQRYKMIRL